MQANLSSITATPSSKRKLIDTSPTDMAMQGAVGNMAVKDLMEMLQVSISTVLDEKLKHLPTKDDLEDVKLKVETFTAKFDEIVMENQMLKERIRLLEENKDNDHKTILRLEEHMKRRNIIIRGVKKVKSVYKAVDSVIKELLKIETPCEFENVRKLYENDEVMAVVVEFKSSYMVQEVLKHTGKLKGTKITIELDLSSERLQDKKVMLQLKKDILFINKTKVVSVRNDKLKIENKWFKWNKSKELVCGAQKGGDVMKAMYGDVITGLDLMYNNIVKKIDSKN